MSTSKIQSLIDEGRYEDAKNTIVDSNIQNKPSGLALRSKIAELMGDFQKSLDLAKQMLDISFTPLHRLQATILVCYAYWRLNQPEDGFIMINRANQIVEQQPFKTREEMRLVSDLYNIAGLIQWKQGNLDKAHALFDGALEIREAQQYELAQSYTLNNIGNTYLKEGDFPNCLTKYEQSMEIRQRLNNQPGIASSLNSLGRYYEAIGDSEKGLEYHQQCANLWHKIGNPQHEAKAYRFIAINLSQRDPQQAKEYFEGAKLLFTEVNNSVDAMITQKLIDKLELE